MFSLIKQVFIVLLSFSSSLTTKCLSLNDEPCMLRPTVFNLNPVKLKYYPLMVSLDKYSGSCKSGSHLSTKICVLSKTKGTHIKAFNMTTNRFEAKTLVKHISCDCKCKFNSTTFNSNI